MKQQADGRTSWLREPEILLLIVLVVAAYLVRIGDVSMRGEEPRRAQVAAEMLQRGDWIVPREQGEPFLSRPPLQNWLIAASTVVCGSTEPWAVRLHSVVALLLTSLLIYGYARTSLSRLGALTAAVAFATFGEMFTTGCQAETEMLFISLIAAALLLWHWGQLRDWPVLGTWIIAYSLVAFAVLCKGPQPPVYFLAPVSLYLLMRGEWRRLLSWRHVVGAATGAAIVLAWLVPCALRTSWPEVWGIFMNDTAGRFRDWQVREVAEHFVRFPIEVLGSTLPWSLFLLGLLSRDLRRSLGEARPLTLFMALCVVTAFPTCWIPPTAQTRYFAPLYPCLAVLIGVVVEGCARMELPSRLRAGWSQFSLLLTGTMLLAAMAVILAALLLRDHPTRGVWAEPLPFALAYAAATGVLALVTFRARQAVQPAQVRMGVLAVAGFMVLTFTGVLTDVRIRRSEDQAAAIARLKEHLPPGQRLVSFGHIDSLFAYYYGVPVDLFAPETSGTALLRGEALYFCFESEGGWRPVLPCPWEELAVIAMDRNHHATPDRAVVVGRLFPSQPKRVASR